MNLSKSENSKNKAIPKARSFGKYIILESSIRELTDGYQNEARLVEHKETGDFEVQWFVWEVDSEGNHADRRFFWYRYSHYGIEEARNDYRSVSWNVVRKYLAAKLQSKS